MLTTRLGVEASRALGTQLWPRNAPLVLQVVLAIVIADLGAYWGRRTMHLTRTPSTSG